MLSSRSSSTDFECESTATTRARSHAKNRPAEAGVESETTSQGQVAVVRGVMTQEEI